MCLKTKGERVFGMEGIFEKLGFTRENGLFITSENEWQEVFSKRVDEFFESDDAPHAFFCITDKPLILFYKNLGDEYKKKIFRSVWNFNESPIVFIIENESVEIYNGFKYLKDPETLFLIAQSKINDLETSKMNDFSYFELVTGKTWKKYQNDFNYKNRVDYHLLENIKFARKILIDDYEIKGSLANRLIGKVIFTRYLIDREVRLGFKGKSKYLKNDDFAKILEDKNETKGFFVYLQDKFNGDLFNIEYSEYEFISEAALHLLRNLILGSEIKSKHTQLSLFDVYDFSIIPVEFISNVYELFIGEEQSEKGAYYTPIFLVDYIFSQTIGKYFEEKSGQYNCKILDPACGSGVFLVEAYRKIIKQYEKVKKTIINKEAIIKLAEDNIFGIDRDSDAVSVATFSIYLTMLHYQKPADIENFKFPQLKGTNFFEGDFFDKDKFDDEERLKNIDYIIGNPPWGNLKTQKNYTNYIKARKQKEQSQIEISNEEIAQAFLLRVCDFSNLDTKCALIVTSKVLYNLQADTFRKYFLENYSINRVFELSSVRREVFNNSNDPAIAPAVVIFYNYAFDENTDDNTIVHIGLKPSRFFSMFNIFSITRNDYKQVVQKRLKDFDYLWKILLYGSYLDFNFISRLKSDYPDFLEIIQRNNFLAKDGIMIGGSDKKAVPNSYKIKPYIDLKKYKIENFFIEIDEKNLFLHDRVHRNRESNKLIFSPPTLLVSRGIDNKLIPKSAILYKEAIFTHAFTGIKGTNDQLDKLKILNGILVSPIIPYFLLQTGTSVGIEREQINQSEKFSLPFINNPQIPDIVTAIEILKSKIYKEETNKTLSKRLSALKDKLKLNEKNLNEVILESFDLSEKEKSLIDYANDITIPLIMKHKDYEANVLASIKSDDKDYKVLSEYAEVFFDRFEDNFREIGLCFSAEIWRNDYLIAVFFHQTKDKRERITRKDNMNEDVFFEKILRISSEKITDRLFVQKDIRGFEEESFYVIKPNEKRLWHKAIAYLDMYEFADAILRAGMEGLNGRT